MPRLRYWKDQESRSRREDRFYVVAVGIEDKGRVIPIKRKPAGPRSGEPENYSFQSNREAVPIAG